MREQQKPAEALKAYKRWIALDPDSDSAHANYGAFLAFQNRPDDALDEYRQAMRLNPKNARAHYNLAHILMAQGQPNEALIAYRNATEADPQNALAHYNLASALSNMNQLEEAVIEYRRAIDIEPTDPRFHFNLGNALHGLGQLDKAIEAFQKAVKFGPNVPLFRGNLGRALYQKGELEESLAEFDAILKIQPDHQTIHEARGQSLLALGRYAEARADFLTSLQRLPKDHPLREVVPTELQKCERLFALEQNLAELLKGDAKPANREERLLLIEMCGHKKLYAAVVRFSAEILAEPQEPSPTPGNEHRFNVALAAALAGCGQGADAVFLDSKERAQLRQQSLDWFTTELSAWDKQAGRSEAELLEKVRNEMKDWRNDPDLACVRDAGALAPLPAGERDAWQQFWSQVTRTFDKADRK